MKKRKQRPPATVSIQVQFSIGGEQLRAEIAVPSGPTRPRQMLPMIQSLADVVVAQAVKAVEAEGKTISCKKGCGICCRQMVPITAVEAKHLRDLVLKLPEPRRSQILARFAEARQRLEKAGLWDKLLHPEQLSKEEHRPLGLEYFQQMIPCPLLEEESCSIYADRPIACREYLVTSPAEHCAHPSAETVQCVPMPAKVSHALADLGEESASRIIQWLSLITALEWAEAHPQEPPPRPGPELLRELFERLAGKRTPEKR